MKNRIKILLGAVIGSSLLLSSCNFLDVDNYFQATFKEDSIFHSMKNAEGYLWNTPTRFPDAGAIWGNSWNPGETASDEIAVRWQTNEFWGAQFSGGTVNGRNLRQDIWYSMYVVVARCNRMLENIDKVSDMTEAVKRTNFSKLREGIPDKSCRDCVQLRISPIENVAGTKRNSQEMSSL